MTQSSELTSTPAASFASVWTASRRCVQRSTRQLKEATTGHRDDSCYATAGRAAPVGRIGTEREAGTHDMSTQGRMRHQIRVARLLVTTLTACFALLPSCALAGPLLSGYGGPGQGSQAVLGSTLINPPSGGGGGGSQGGGGGGGQAAASSSSSAQGDGAASSQTTPAAPGGGSSRAGTASPRARRRTARRAAAGAGAVAGARAARPTAEASDLPTGTYTPAELAAVHSTGTFGLSSGDLLVALLVAAGLCLTAVITHRLGAGADRRGRQAGVGG
jgi:hypothetical protein